MRAKDHYKTVFDPQYRIIALLVTVVLTGFCYISCGVELTKMRAFRRLLTNTVFVVGSCTFHCKCF